MDLALATLHVIAALALAPLMVGLLSRTKAIVAGRRGRPLMQLWFDVIKLLQKGAVYSRTTTWLFRAGPVVGLACALVALTLVPFGGHTGLLHFGGDVILLAYVLGLARLATVLAALDTGSAFEGMGASREVSFSALAEPALFLCLASLARLTGELSLSAMVTSMDLTALDQGLAVSGLVAAALLIVGLTENARIPIDDPETHLELTMIHEVMVLDHSGVDLAFIQYGASLKLWLFGALTSGILLPLHSGHWWLDSAAALGGMACFAVGVGLIESGMARLRLLRVPQLLVVASALATLALLIALR